jgi:iron complex transport system substrate-binding protein
MLKSGLTAGAALCLAACGVHPASLGTRTVLDMTGRPVQIPAAMNRVATNIPLIPPTMELLDGIDTLVAAPTSSFNPLFTTIAPTTRDVLLSPVRTINAEELLKLHPQVFIMTNLTPQLLPTLERLNIPVVEISDLGTPERLQTMVQLVADVLGGDAPSRARQYESYFNETVQRVEAKTASLPDPSRPTVYYAPGPDPSTTIGKGNIITSSIEEAGGRNIAAEHGIGANKPGAFAFPAITAEALLAWNPQVIVAIDAKVHQQFLSDPKYAALDAVRSHRVYACPVGVFAWCASSSESALAPVFLAKVLHPDLFADLNLNSETNDFYSRFYSYRLSDRQVDEILSGSGR